MVRITGFGLDARIYMSDSKHSFATSPRLSREFCQQRSAF
jgi:hypothetical protein